MFVVVTLQMWIARGGEQADNQAAVTVPAARRGGVEGGMRWMDG